MTIANNRIADQHSFTEYAAGYATTLKTILTDGGVLHAEQTEWLKNAGAKFPGTQLDKCEALINRYILIQVTKRLKS